MDYSSVEIRRLELLGAVIARLDHGAEQVALGDLMSDPGDSEEREALTADAHALAQSELLNLDERLGAWTATPRRGGRDEWATFVSQRADPVERSRQLRNDYLRWVYSETRGGGRAVADDFLDSGVTYLGSPYTLDELIQAGKWLKDRDFIDGPGADQRPDPLRPAPTVKGEDWIEARRDVHEESTSGGGASASYTFLGPAQVAHGSHHVTQIQHNIREQAHEIAAALLKLADLEVGESREELVTLAQEMQKEADGAARPNRIKQVGDKVLNALGSGVGGALGSFVSANLTNFLATLP